MADMLPDTTVLIDLARGDSRAADFVDNALQKKKLLYISIVSAMELFVGCRNKNEVATAKKLLANFHAIHMSPGISQKAYYLIQEFGLSHGLRIPDALIAATALVESLELMSDNERHFHQIPYLTVRRPY